MFELYTSDTTAVIFLILGLFLMVAELKLPTSGVVGVLGMLSFILGTTMVDDAVYALGIAPFTLWASVTTLCLAFMALFVWSYHVLKTRPTTGENLLVGKTAKVLSWNGTEGKVTIYGEVWKAESEETLPSPTEVIITAVADHKLHVTLNTNPNKD